MGVIADLKKYIYEEEVRYRSSVSEGTWFKIGGVINFLLKKNYQVKEFFVNGPYSIKPFPHYFEDGIQVFQFDSEIFDVWVFNLVSGSSGDTEFDIKIKPQNSGAWTSIFTVKPKINFAAGEKWIKLGDVIANTTAGVLTSDPNVLQVNAGDAIRLDLIQGQLGAQNCGAIIHYRPR